MIRNKKAEQQTKATEMANFLKNVLLSFRFVVETSRMTQSLSRAIRESKRGKNIFIHFFDALTDGASFRDLYLDEGV